MLYKLLSLSIVGYASLSAIPSENGTSPSSDHPSYISQIKVSKITENNPCNISTNSQVDNAVAPYELAQNSIHPLISAIYAPYICSIANEICKIADETLSHVRHHNESLSNKTVQIIDVSPMLFESIQNGDLLEVMSILTFDSLPDPRILEIGLAYAFLFNKVNIADYIISRGAKINIFRKELSHLFYEVLESRNIDLATCMINAGVTFKLDNSKLINFLEDLIYTKYASFLIVFFNQALKEHCSIENIIKILDSRNATNELKNKFRELYRKYASYNLC